MSDEEMTTARPLLETPNPEPGTPLSALLLTLADDELILGWWDSEWTGIAPVLEEDVAMSSVAQDEIGHALAFYELLATETGVPPDDWAYQRQPDDYRFARLIGHARGDWTFTIARRFLYETADAVRLATLEQSSHTPLANLVAKMRREERYHLMHFQTWFERFVNGPTESRERLARAIEGLWADALDLFAPLEGEDALIRDAVLPEPMESLQARWVAMLAPSLERAGASVIDRQMPGEPRRGGTHPDFPWLHHEMTMVYRLEPGAEW